MFKPKLPKAVNTIGYHVSEQMKLELLEGFLNSLSPNARVISIAHLGSAGQQVYVVYKI